ncbi:MAG: hypothetical protein LQ351_007024 [Letrouitia transgressa]|nr:MAG: hypothetical protein LQ351_007024 [Letrouitia transgressa]
MTDDNQASGPSLADRMTNADGSKFQSPKPTPENVTDAASSSGPAGKSSSWADEVETPVEANTEPATEPKSGETQSDLANAQFDGATEPQRGTPFLNDPSYDVNVKLSDVQADPNNPLYSITDFKDLGLDENVLKGIYQMRFQKPSKIQEKALPLLLANPPTNMIGQSQSGTGKTAAFVLNILARLDLSSPQMRSTPQAMVLAPSRELARQIIGVIQVMGTFVEGLQVAAAIPTEAADRKKVVTSQIVVGTPGTTMDMIKRRLINPQHIKVLVLDEADNMLDQQGLGDQCLRVKRGLPPNIQVVLFSATFPDQVVQYAERFAPGSNQITLRHEELTVEGIKQLYLDCPSEEKKYETLVRLYGLMTIGSSIIFVKASLSTRATALKVEQKMNAEGHRCACLTGEFEGKARDLVIDAFREGRAKVLITTNVLSRGIDVQSVSLVVNYDLPDLSPSYPHSADNQTYLHRIGRTGRFGRVGVSISLISGNRDWRLLSEIQDYFNVKMIGLDTRDWDGVEESIKAVLKSNRAQANFRPEGMAWGQAGEGRGRDVQM